MKDAICGLSAGDVLKRTYELLIERLSGRPLELGRTPIYVPAHKNSRKRGHIVYDRFARIQAVRNEWVIGLGVRDEDQLSNKFHSAILATRLTGARKPLKDWQLVPAVQEKVDRLHNSVPFNNTLIIAKANGEIVGVDGGPFQSLTDRHLKPEVPSWLRTSSETSAAYEPDSVQKLAAILERILAES